MSECDATVGQVAKGTTASFALGPHGASVCGRTEHALPGVGVVGGVWALVGGCADGVCGVFGGRIVPFAPAVEVFGVVGGVGVDEIGVFGALGVVFVPVGGVFGGRIVPFAPVGDVFGDIALGLVPADGVGVDEIGDFGGVGAVFVPVFGRSDGVCGAFGGRIVPFAPVGAVFGLVCEAFGGVCSGCAFAVGVFGSASAAFGAAEGETGAKRSASDGAGGADVDEATEEGAAERRLC